MSKKDKTGLDNISYGDDLSEHIARLIAPPNNCKIQEGGTKGVKPNNDFCSFCSEGGRLICCERCPAAYHYHCCEPPLDPGNLPSEEWLCNSCTPPKTLNNINNSNKFLNCVKLDIGSIPTPFDLPDELYPHSDLPGSTELQSRKRKHYNPIFAEQYKRKFNPAYPDDHRAFTRTPVCYKCDKSGLGNKPLIYCSYCPLAFHLDCLYPPLPFRPNGLWMCPLHPQYSTPNFHALRLSVRLQAHERCLDPVSEHTIRKRFLKKAKKCQNIVRSNDRAIQRLTSIPGAIEQYYQLGVAFCRSNVSLTSPKALTVLCAEKVSENMVKREHSQLSVSSVCVKLGCKHATKHCKHYTKVKREPGYTTHTTQHIDNVLAGMSEKTIRHLAGQFLDQEGWSMSNGDVKPSFVPPSHKGTDGCISLCHQVSQSHLVAHSYLKQGDTKYSIKKNSFIMGVGLHADLRLDPTVCKAVSLRHSCILFDKVTGVHELLNYSEYGTVVNSLYYGCSTYPQCSCRSNSTSYNKDTCGCHGNISRCSCLPTVPVHGWEGPCQLTNGAVIKVGCNTFTFHRNPEFVWTPEVVLPSSGGD